MRTKNIVSVISANACFCCISVGLGQRSQIRALRVATLLVQTGSKTLDRDGGNLALRAYDRQLQSRSFGFERRMACADRIGSVDKTAFHGNLPLKSHDFDDIERSQRSWIYKSH